MEEKINALYKILYAKEKSIIERAGEKNRRGEKVSGYSDKKRTLKPNLSRGPETLCKDALAEDVSTVEETADTAAQLCRVFRGELRSSSCFFNNYL